MFNKKEHKEIPLVEKREIALVCETCGCLVDIHAAKTVNFYNKVFPDFGAIDLHYCIIHAPNYTKKIRHYSSDVSYYKEMQVDEKGEPVGYKKLTK